MNEWIKTNAIAMLMMVFAIGGSYTAFIIGVNSVELQVAYMDKRLTAAENRLGDHALRLTNAEKDNYGQTKDIQNLIGRMDQLIIRLDKMIEHNKGN